MTRKTDRRGDGRNIFSRNHLGQAGRLLQGRGVSREALEIHLRQLEIHLLDAEIHLRRPEIHLGGSEIHLRQREIHLGGAEIHLRPSERHLEPRKMNLSCSEIYLRRLRTSSLPFWRLGGLPELFVLGAHGRVEGLGHLGREGELPDELEDVGEVLQAVGRAQA